MQQRVVSQDYQAPPLTKYGEPGNRAEAILAGGSLGYYLEQMPEKTLLALASRNVKQFAILTNRKNSDLDTAGMLAMMHELGKQTRKGKIQARSVVDHLTGSPLALADGNTEISEALAWGVWRWSNYLVDANKHRRTTLVRNGAIAATLVAGAVLSIGRLKANNQVIEPVIAKTSVSLITPQVLATPRTTRTPEPAATLNPETQMGKDWAAIIKQYKSDGHDFLGALVIGAEPINDFSSFQAAVLKFLVQHNQLTNEGAISYNPGEGSEIFLWTDNDNQALRVRFDGQHVTPPWIPHTFYYSLGEGICAATADQPLDNGTWQNSEIKFDPAKPQVCVAFSNTWSGRNIVVAFIPENGHVTIKAAIFRAE